VAEDSLEPLVTQCPTCRTRFRVTEVQLGVAGGRVRCGACLSVFTGLDNLVLGAGPRLRPGESADAALDELLDELRSDSPPRRTEPAPARPSMVPRDAAPDDSAARPRPPDESPERKRAVVPTRPGVVPHPAPEPEVHAQLEPKREPAPEFEAAAEAGLEPDPGSRRGEAIELSANDDSDAVAPRGDAPAPAHERVGSRAVRARPGASRGVTRKGRAALGPAVAADGSANVASAAAADGRSLRRPLDVGVDPEALMATPPRRRRRWWMWPVLLLCVALLGAQVLYLQFEVWATNPEIRPVYEWLCPRLGCQLPEMRALDKMHSKNLVVRANPDIPSALLVDAIIVNEASFPQPFPDIELRFSSMGGNLIAGRRFRPDEYLAGEMKGVRMIAPLTPVHIALEIEDPGQDAVNYVMVFR
jgi:predicted Zn finger-like uncharacterized protein